jgi:iron(III) transport system substrate-binding protein
MTALGVALAFFVTPGAWAADPPVLQGASDAEKARVRKLIEGAKKEGEVVHIGQSVSVDVIGKLFSDFKEQYGLPNLKMRHTIKRSTGVISAVKKDISAKRNSFDVVQVGSAIFYGQLIKRGHLMNYASPNYANFADNVTGKKKGAAAVPGHYVSSMINVFALVWNPKYVKEDLKTWEDVLKPKYKGKIIVADILKSATIVNIYGGLRTRVPKSYFEKLAKLDPMFILSHRSIVRKIVAGEKWIGVMTSVGLAYKSAKKGVKIKAAIPPGGTVALGYPFVLLSKAPHPNAGKLWMDYLHSRRGHNKFLNLQGFLSGIKDSEPNALLKSFIPPIEKLDVIPMDWTKIGMKDVTKWRAEYRKIFYGK